MKVKDMTTDDLPFLEAQLQHALDKALASEPHSGSQCCKTHHRAPLA